MTYKEARVYLDEVSKYGSVLGLDTIQNLLRELHNPQDGLKFIHIAGTNGKGSVLAYTSTILSEAGYRTGRYVSPTVISYLERIQIDGRWIQEEDFAELVEEVQRAIARMEAHGETVPTVFEVETAVAFLYFKKKNCDIVVLETGLGGSLDATNIVKNTLIAAFASISRDHMGFLGDTLPEIAENKAGIIKPGCTVITAEQKPDVMRILKERAQQLRCPVISADMSQAVILEAGYKGQTFSYKDMEAISIRMAGRYQIGNALTALEIILAVRKLGYSVSKEALSSGFKKTVWPGRFSCVCEEPVFIVDGAHNEDAARVLRESVEQYFQGRRLIYIMGVFRDKEYDKISKIMGPLADKIYTVELPDEKRTLDASSLKRALDPYCKDVDAVGDIRNAVNLAFEEAKKEDVILAFGSLSYLGQVMQVVENMRGKL